MFGKQNLSEGTRVICCGTQKTSCFFAFFGPEKTVTVHHGHCVFHSAIEGCARTCSHVALLHLPKSDVAPPDFSLFKSLSIGCAIVCSIKYLKGSLKGILEDNLS